VTRAFDGVLWDFRGTLFGDEDDATWIRSSGASIGRSLSDGEVAAIIERLDATEPQHEAALSRCDASLAVHRATNLAWFADAGIDSELAVAIWARDGHPDATFAFTDAAEVMAVLQAHAVRMVVISNIHYDIRDHFRRHGLDQYVDAYVLSFEHGCQKPDAEMYTRALELLDVPADRALMVGDTPSLDAEAVKYGIATYMLPGPFRAGRSGARGLDAVLRLVGIANP
jgi:FMN phosphatase YigB (HAD superfamily)